MLYGVGWTQRWRIADGMEQQIADEITRVGQAETSQLSVLDPGSEATATLVVALGTRRRCSDPQLRRRNPP